MKLTKNNKVGEEYRSNPSEKEHKIRYEQIKTETLLGNICKLSDKPTSPHLENTLRNPSKHQTHVLKAYHPRKVKLLATQ